MTKSRDYIPDFRCPTEVCKQDDDMEPYYRTATFLDGDIDGEETSFR